MALSLAVYSASKYNVTLKTGIGVVQGHWKWRRSIDHIRLSIGPPAVSRTIFKLFDVEWYRDLEIWVRGHSRSFKPVPFKSLGAVSYSPSIVTIAYIICEIKWDVGRKSWFFSYPLAFDVPVRGFPSEYCHPVWYGKTRMVGLLDGEKTFEFMYNRLHTIRYRRVTDRQTDRQTSCHGIVRAMHTRRAIKTNI